MSFSPLHIWASMGPLSKVIASILLLMATMLFAVWIARFFGALGGPVPS